MDDKTLLERAAKAAGIPPKLVGAKPGFYALYPETDGVEKFCCMNNWNPLLDDGDEARLEAVCEIEIEWCRLGVIASRRTPDPKQDVRIRVLYADHGGDKQKARRYAGVRAAAAIGSAHEAQ